MPDAGQDSGTFVGDAGSDAGTDAGIDAGTDGGADLCATNNGGCDALTTCSVGTDGGVVCGACPSGYSGDGASGCADINECTTTDAGCGTQECVNTNGGFMCVPPPVSVMLSELGQSSYIGDSNASARWGQCWPGQVVVGYDFTQRTASPYAISSAAAYCSDLTLSGSGSNLTVSTTLPARTGTSRLCAQNEVVAGLAANISAGGYGTEVDSIAVQCAPISVTQDGGTASLTVGASYALDLFPSTGPAVNSSTQCPAGGVAYGINEAGSQWLFGLALRCAAPTFHRDVPTIVFGQPNSTNIIGASQQQTANTDLCNDGGVVTGLMLEPQWRSYAVRCSTPVLDAPPGVPLMNPQTLRTEGSPPPSFELGCGPSGTVAGFGVYAGSTFLYRLDLECAAMGANSDGGTWTVSVDSPSAGPSFGAATATPDQTVACPAGTAPIGFQARTTTQSNSYVELSGVGLVCAPPTAP